MDKNKKNIDCLTPTKIITACSLIYQSYEDNTNLQEPKYYEQVSGSQIIILNRIKIAQQILN